MSHGGNKQELCCICGVTANALDMVSSHRFERFFQPCFNLNKPRAGLLCSSCLSCVRKWRKSSKDRRKSMSSVVDSRKFAKKAKSDEPLKKISTSVGTEGAEKSGDIKSTDKSKDSGNLKQAVERKRHRSLVGCCICGAKSSATEFVNSDKLSRFIKDCFQLDQKREGEICHACREIVRKWRRQPRGDKQNYNHIVDSKIVPKKKYSSSSSRSKSGEQKESNTPEGKVDIKSVGQIFTYDNAPDDTLSEDDDDVDDDDSRDVGLDTPSPSPASSLASGSEYSDPFDPPQKKMVSTASQTAFLFPMLTSPQGVNSRLPFIDLSTWRQESICCGSIFRGPNGEVLVDPKWLKPYCDFCNRSAQPPTPIEKNNPTEISVF